MTAAIHTPAAVNSPPSCPGRRGGINQLNCGHGERRREAILLQLGVDLGFQCFPLAQRVPQLLQARGILGQHLGFHCNTVRRRATLVGNCYNFNICLARTPRACYCGCVHGLLVRIKCSLRVAQGNSEDETRPRGRWIGTGRCGDARRHVTDPSRRWWRVGSLRRGVGASGRRQARAGALVAAERLVVHHRVYPVAEFVHLHQTLAVRWLHLPHHLSLQYLSAKTCTARAQRWTREGPVPSPRLHYRLLTLCPAAYWPCAPRLLTLCPLWPSVSVYVCMYVYIYIYIYVLKAGQHVQTQPAAALCRDFPPTNPLLQLSRLDHAAWCASPSPPSQRYRSARCGRAFARRSTSLCLCATQHVLCTHYPTTCFALTAVYIPRRP